MKKKIIFIVMISLLISMNLINLQAMEPNILNKQTVKVRGYEGFGFLEYGQVNKKAFKLAKSYVEDHGEIKGTKIHKIENNMGSDYTGKGLLKEYILEESNHIGDGLKNGDVVSCRIDRKSSSKLPFRGSLRIEIKGLKKIPKRIDFKKYNKKIEDAFNQLLYGVDGAGRIQTDFLERRKDSIKPYNSDINFKNLEIIKINNSEYLESRDNGKLKNGDVVTIKIPDNIEESLKLEDIKVLSNTVDVKVNSLINPLEYNYKNSKEKIESPISIPVTNYELTTSENLNSVESNIMNKQTSAFILDNDEDFYTEDYGLYVANNKSEINDGYSIEYPLYLIKRRKSKDGKIDYKVTNNLWVSLLPNKKIYWGARDAVTPNFIYCDSAKNWNTPMKAVVAFSKYEKRHFKKYDLICLWNKDNNFETLSIKERNN